MFPSGSFSSSKYRRPGRVPPCPLLPKFVIAPQHPIIDRRHLLLRREPRCHLPRLGSRPIPQHSIRPPQRFKCGSNGNHTNPPPLLADRISKRPMCSSPSIQFHGALPARIDIGESHGFITTGNGEFEAKIVFLSAHRSVVSPTRDQEGMKAQLFNKFDLLILGGKPVQAGMFQDVIKREKPPHDNQRSGFPPVTDVLDSERTINPLA